MRGYYKVWKVDLVDFGTDGQHAQFYGTEKEAKAANNLDEFIDGPLRMFMPNKATCLEMANFFEFNDEGTLFNVVKPS